MLSAWWDPPTLPLDSTAQFSSQSPPGQPPADPERSTGTQPLQRAVPPFAMPWDHSAETLFASRKQLQGSQVKYSLSNDNRRSPIELTWGMWFESILRSAHCSALISLFQKALITLVFHALHPISWANQQQAQVSWRLWLEPCGWP